VPDIEFRDLLPALFLPTFLRQRLGYRTHAMVSMPVLNPLTGINRDFDTYQLMPSHNDMAAMVDAMRFDGDRPTFHLLNVGETHYPYAVPGDDPSEWPRISGVHGLVKRLDDDAEHAATDAAVPFFDDETMEQLRQRQVRSVRYIDTVVERLFDVVPDNTWVVVTSDHGELFGEGGYFGHGPIAHEKVLEVPFVEGLLR
jgi:arylsulfatase A-like enzyme